MKLLKVEFNGLPLVNGKGEIDFVASQRVTGDNAEKATLLFAQNNLKIYLNNVLSLIGINASGKTTILKTLAFVFGVLNNQSLNNSEYIEIFDGLNSDKDVIFDTCFYDSGCIYFLNTVIEKKDRLVIKEETLKEKPIGKIKKKADLYSLEGIRTIMQRNNEEAFLLDDVSIMVAFNKKRKTNFAFVDMLRYTNVNKLTLAEDCPAELIGFFDPNIEYINVENNSGGIGGRLKFFGKDEIKLEHIADVDRYLSSGTIKGINTFLSAMKIFSSGGYLIIDELENHFNHEIVSTLVRLFMDKKVNKAGASLVFSTHFAEILNEFDRNDCIYIIRNKGGITIDNLSTILKRNDIKKSEAYESGFLSGTTPSYDSYINLKRHLISLKKAVR